ncbi:hypothetical protein [Azospirillum argentinense]|nr:hypothetical protein [Azospirillum argentinense]
MTVTTIDGAARRTAQSLGIRHFLQWLAKDGQPAADTLRGILIAAAPGDLSEVQAVHLLASAVNRWIGAMSRAPNTAAHTVRGYAYTAANTLEALGALPDRRYPQYMHSLVSVPRAVGKISTLGRLQWPEFEGVNGIAARERLGLSLVRQAAVAEFDRHERFFRFGQDVLAGRATMSQADGTSGIPTLLEAERRSWETTGRSQFDPVNEVSPEIAALLAELRDIRIWEAAGLSIGSRMAMLKDFVLHNVALMCCGPTFHASMMVAVVFCCDTGWNRQPILGLPRDPFIFRTRSECGIATSAFVESFKRRADHNVLAYLESASPVSGLAEERMRREWDAATNDYDRTGRGDGISIMDRTAPLLDVLDRYQQMTDVIRGFDLGRAYEKDFFVYLAKSGGLFRSDGRSIRENGRGSVLARDGVSFQSLRKTYLSLRVRETGSVTATQTIAGHTSGGVLMPHYLNDADITAELDRSIRFFQNACQALILSDQSIRVHIGLTAAELDWFRRLAEASGISAAVGLERDFTTKSTRPLYFSPTEDNLRDLFLAHKALRAARQQVHPGRWAVQGLPLLAAVKAIGQAVFGKGLKHAYQAVARRTQRALNAGSITLPPILEG